jgi:error-prone DNA polymerase
MLETVTDARGVSGFCNNCAHDWTLTIDRFLSIDDLVARTGINREELSVLAEIGALTAFGHTRREALWQVERAVRPAGELFAGSHDARSDSEIARSPDVECPLPGMSAVERVVADYEGTGMTIGPHPMAMRREEMSLRGALRASDLSRQRHGRRVRVAGAVITRQRPGTAKGFVFLTLEDETGIANIIIRPDLFAEQRMAVIHEPFLLVEGMLQNQEGVTSVRAERVEGIRGTGVDVAARDFY